MADAWSYAKVIAEGFRQLVASLTASVFGDPKVNDLLSRLDEYAPVEKHDKHDKDWNLGG